MSRRAAGKSPIEVPVVWKTINFGFYNHNKRGKGANEKECITEKTDVENYLEGKSRKVYQVKQLRYEVAMSSSTWGQEVVALEFPVRKNFLKKSQPYMGRNT